MIPVIVLGATRLIGQVLLQRLVDHPVLSVRAVCDLGPDRAAMPYAQACDWAVSPAMPAGLEALEHHSGSGDALARLASPDALVLSVLPDGQSEPVDRAFAAGGSRVITHASECRLQPDIPLVVPDTHPIPPDAMVIATPNCTTVMLSLLLSALRPVYGIDAVSVVALQALSGADLQGPRALGMLGNVDPHLVDEALALERETARLFAGAFPVSAQCARVPVRTGHTLFISFKTSVSASRAGILSCLNEFRLSPERALAATALERPFRVTEIDGRPRPVPDADALAGMALSVGGVAPCPVNDWRCVLVGNNMERGSAATLLFTAELIASRFAA